MSLISSPASPKVGKRLAPHYLWLGVAAAALAPWALTWWFVPNHRVDWECLSNLEFDTQTPDGKLVQAYGTMTSRFNKDGSGTSRFLGRLRLGETLSVVHRVNEFNYVWLNSLIRVNTVTASRIASDDANDALVYRYVNHGFEPGHTDYFQAMRVGNAVAVGFNGLPRAYCAPVPATASSK
ncbi:hypothetical protein [Pandoraea sp. NPDC087047]|uniref:hypothetical protein n=1 Tax=Pandoraea sp. NPDC087047 TaxID=3364390 RepID=UPI00381E6F50